MDLPPIPRTGSDQVDPVSPQFIHFTNAQTGYLVFNKTILKTVDDGDRGLIASENANHLFVTRASIGVPAPPANLQAVSGSRQVHLRWDRVTGLGVAGYRVERAAPGGPHATVATMTSTAYLDLPPGYRPRLRCRRGSGRHLP